MGTLTSLTPASWPKGRDGVAPVLFAVRGLRVLLHTTRREDSRLHDVRVVLLLKVVAPALLTHRVRVPPNEEHERPRSRVIIS